MKYRNWIFLLVANLFIVALLGLLMRYKIAFSLPVLDQKHLQHAHSHFAFIAWVSQALYLMLIHFLEENSSINTKIYDRILTINTILSLGMLVSFLLKGYHFSSNSFSFLLIVNSLFFTYHFIKDSIKIRSFVVVKCWFYAALFFNFLSTFGTFHLVYLMANKIFNQEMQLASVYFYLHFQYNGWFIFACLGMLLYQYTKQYPLKYMNVMFWIFFVSSIPNYFLSILWLKIPTSVYLFVILSAFSQLCVWGYLLFQFNKQKRMVLDNVGTYFKWIVWVLIIAFTFKLSLQLVSTVPYISHLAYSLRPIVIAYLHLVLLVIISMFLLQYFYKSILRKSIPKSVMYFFASILVNELFLGIQGFAGIFTINISYIHYFLFAISICIFLSVASMLNSFRSL